MAYGTAKIRHYGKVWLVTWHNHGNDLRNDPRAFWTEAEAQTWCREHDLKIVA